MIVAKRPRTVRRWLAAAGLSGLAAAGCIAAATGPARADGVLNVTETRYVAEHGDWVVCTPIAAAPTPATVIAVVGAVMGDGFTADSAVDIVNGSVLAHCPSRWPLLQRVGALARGEKTAAA